MNRLQLLRLLSGAVAASWITTAQATAVRQRYDNGETLELPLPPEQAIQRVTLEQAAAALVTISGLLGRRTDILTIIIRRQPPTRDQLQDAFQARARVMALLPVPEWHESMRDHVRDHVLGQYALGLGRELRTADLRAIEGDVLTQLGYLSRFADERAAKELAGVPLSDAQIVARNELYSGAGRAAWFRGHEQSFGDGYVFDYQSRDDGGVCSPCLTAEQRSPFLAGRGVFPGSVCLGRGHCRCVRTERYDPPVYTRLTGRTLNQS